MNLEYNPFWFVVLWAVGFFFISLAILFAIGIAYEVYGITIDDLEECIKQGIVPKLCIAMFPPPPLQGVNWTVPFP